MGCEQRWCVWRCVWQCASLVLLDSLSALNPLCVWRSVHWTMLYRLDVTVSLVSSPSCPFSALSPSSLQVERCYYFLQACVETAQRKEPVDGRLVQFLLSNPTNDGGQWDMLVNLIGQFIPVIPRSGECCCFVCIMLCHYVVAESRIAPYSLYQVLPWPRGHM